jgi:ABC-type multidrug transport system ATPase subunit
VPPEELINWFPLFEVKLSKTVDELSGGQRRLLELCIVALPPAACILLDEPFTHLDPVHIQTAKDLLMQQKHQKAVLITDQMYEHLTDVCDRIYLLANGKTHAVSALADLIRLGYIGG